MEKWPSKLSRGHFREIPQLGHSLFRFTLCGFWTLALIGCIKVSTDSVCLNSHCDQNNEEPFINGGCLNANSQREFHLYLIDAGMHTDESSPNYCLVGTDKHTVYAPSLQYALQNCAKPPYSATLTYLQANYKNQRSPELQGQFKSSGASYGATCARLSNDQHRNAFNDTWELIEDGQANCQVLDLSSGIYMPKDISFCPQ
jgi:hypothetical protein